MDKVFEKNVSMFLLDCFDHVFRPILQFCDPISTTYRVLLDVFTWNTREQFVADLLQIFHIILSTVLRVIAAYRVEFNRKVWTFL